MWTAHLGRGDFSACVQTAVRCEWFALLWYAEYPRKAHFHFLLKTNLILSLPERVTEVQSFKKGLWNEPADGFKKKKKKKG